MPWINLRSWFLTALKGSSVDSSLERLRKLRRMYRPLVEALEDRLPPVDVTGTSGLAHLGLNADQILTPGDGLDDGTGSNQDYLITNPSSTDTDPTDDNDPAPPPTNDPAPPPSDGGGSGGGGSDGGGSNGGGSGTTPNAGGSSDNRTDDSGLASVFTNSTFTTNDSGGRGGRNNKGKHGDQPTRNRGRRHRKPPKRRPGHGRGPGKLAPPRPTRTDGPTVTSDGPTVTNPTPPDAGTPRDNPSLYQPLSISRISDDNGMSPRDGITNDNQIAVHGHATPSASVTVEVDGLTNGTTTADSNGTWALALNGTLSDGAHTLEARTFTATAGTETTHFSVTVDTVAPNVAVSAPSYPGNTVFSVKVNTASSDEAEVVGAIIIDADLNMDGDFDDTGELGVGQGPAGLGEFQVQVQLRRGNANVRARISDQAGNVGISNNSQVNIPLIYFGDPQRVPEPIIDRPPGEPMPVDVPGDSSGSDGSSGSGDSSGSGSGGGTVVFAQIFINEVEPNNTAATAQQININNVDTFIINGGISATTDQDFYQFTLAQRSGVFFDTDAVEIGLSNVNTVLTLFDNNNTQLDTNDNGYDFDTGFPAQDLQPSATTADSGLYRDLNAGTYNIRVTSTGNTTGNYQLVIRADSTFNNQVPVLDSKPGAPATVFLDFNGHQATESGWNGGQQYTIPAFDFNGNGGEYTPGERLAMTNIWKVMAEDLSPFNINVSTTYTGPFQGGVANRAIFGGDRTALPNNNIPASVIGVALLNSWSTAAGGDESYFTFADDPYWNSADNNLVIMGFALEQGNVAAHEGGHTFNLNHYGGGNTIPNAIMNDTSGGIDRAIWAEGNTSTNEPPVFFQDDLAVVSRPANTFGFRPDDAGNATGSATTLTTSTTNYTFKGVISHQSADQDFFRFLATPGGPTTITVTVDDYVNDLDTELRVYNLQGSLIASDDQSNSYDARLVLNLAPGTYFVEVRSDGAPGEVGQYDLTINVATPPPSDGGGGGGGRPRRNRRFNFSNDALEANETSDRATDFGFLNGQQTKSGLTIVPKPNDLPDYDWFHWVADLTGTFTASITVGNTAFGDDELELRIFTLNGVTLNEVGKVTVGERETGTLSFNFDKNDDILVEVKGKNIAIGVFGEAAYDLKVNLA